MLTFQRVGRAYRNLFCGARAWNWESGVGRTFAVGERNDRRRREADAGIVIIHVAETTIGGIESYLNEVVPYQAQEESISKVILIVPQDRIPYLPRLNGVAYRPFRRSGRNLQSFCRLIAEFLSAAGEQPVHIIHVHSTFAGMLIRPFCVFFPHAKVVYCAHGWAFTMEAKPWKTYLYAWAERVLAPLSDAIVTISRSEYVAALSSRLSAEKLLMIYNGVADRRSLGLRDDQRVHDLWLPKALCETGCLVQPDEIRCLFVGRFDHQKAFDLLMETFARLQDRPIHLTAVGGFVLGGWRVSIPVNVKVVGWLNREQLDCYYRNADVLIVPSRWEGFGLVAIESMCHGTPVIASNRGALPEIVSNGQSGLLFAIEDENSLYGLLVNLDREQLRRMRPHARENYLLHFNADIMNSKLLDLYWSLVGWRRR
jgi:glycosyltransferase involved in cell wall biosynthesis